MNNIPLFSFFCLVAITNGIIIRLLVEILEALKALRSEEKE